MKNSPGDVFEIRTGKGLAYAILTHKNRLMGDLLWVASGFFGVRPQDIRGLFSSGDGFHCFTLASQLVKEGVAKKIASIDLPLSLQRFPVFRNGFPDPQTGLVKEWWFWDGEREWCVGAITAEQRKMPLQEAWNHIALLENLESGWHPETVQE